METSSANFENIHDYSPGIVLLPACLKLKCVNVCFKKKTVSLFVCESQSATVAQPIVSFGGGAICLIDQWKAGGVVRNLFEHSHFCSL